MGLEDLVGKPSYELLPRLVQRCRIKQLYLTGFELSTYSSDNSLHPVDSKFFEQPNWWLKANSQINRQFVGICSRVLLEDRFAHIPMLDYDDVDNKEAKVPDLKRLLKALFLPEGVIIRSGSGLHYIGGWLMDERGLPLLLKEGAKGRFKWQRGRLGDVDHPGVDSQWIIIAEEKGFMELRLNAGEGRPEQPRIIEVFRADPTSALKGSRRYGIDLLLDLDLLRL